MKYKLNAFRYESNGNNPYQFEYVFDDFIATQDSLLKCSVLKYTNQYAAGYICYELDTGQMIKEIGVTKNGSYVVMDR